MTHCLNEREEITQTHKIDLQNNTLILNGNGIDFCENFASSSKNQVH